MQPETSPPSSVVTRRAREESRAPKTLRPPSYSPLGLLRSVTALGEYVDLLLVLTAHRIRVRYKQTALGVSWAVLQPISIMCIYTVVFSHIAKMPSEGVPYALFFYTALLPWLFFSSSVTQATGSILSHSHLITKIYFPREILPLTYVIAALFDFVLASAILIVLIIYYQVTLTANALYLIPLVFAITCYATAAALFFSAVQVRFRDIGFAVPLILQLWMFATPVMYPLSVVPERYRALFALNPMAVPIEGFRRALLRGEAPDPSMMTFTVLLGLVLLPASYMYFKRVEATAADII